MALSVVIILSALAILIVAFFGVFGRFPGNWEWVGIVLAGLGIAMGVPSVLQRIYGRPKLLTNYDKHVQDQERALIVFLKNPPLEPKSLLAKLGVRRDTIASLSASFRISEKAKVTIPIMHSRIYSDDDPTEAGSWRIALPPTFSWSTSIMIAMWDNAKKKAIVLGDTARSPVELSDGLYRMDIIYLVDGQPIKEFREFIIGKKADDLVWIKPPQSRN
jgi:hypothetical protein